MKHLMTILTAFLLITTSAYSEDGKRGKITDAQKSELMAKFKAFRSENKSLRDDFMEKNYKEKLEKIKNAYEEKKAFHKELDQYEEKIVFGKKKENKEIRQVMKEKRKEFREKMKEKRQEMKKEHKAKKEEFKNKMKERKKDFRASMKEARANLKK